MLNKIYLLLILIFFIFPVNNCLLNTLIAKERPRIAVLDFTSENVRETYARAVRNIFEISLYKTGNFDILERNKMESILKEQGFQMTGCIDTSCAVQIGKILSVDMVVIGSLNKLGKYTVAAKFINVGHGRIELADFESADTEDGIQNAVNAIAGRMAGNIGNKAAEASQERKTSPRTASDDSKEQAPSEKSSNTFNLTIKGSYMLPQGIFNKLVDAGYGASASITTENILIRNSLVGIEAGYWRFPGGKNNVDYCAMIPVLVTAGYKYNIPGSFYIAPTIGIGISYNILSWDKDGSSDGTYKYTKAAEFEYLAKAGLAFGYVLSDFVSIQLGTDFLLIFEKKPLGFLPVSAGICVKY